MEKSFPKESCQCSVLGTCYHILVARMSIGLTNVPETRICNLKHERERERGQTNGRERKSHVPVMNRRSQLYQHRIPKWLEEMSFAASTQHLGITMPMTPSSIMKKSRKTPKSRKKIAFTSPIVEQEEVSHNPETTFGKSPLRGR